MSKKYCCNLFKKAIEICFFQEHLSGDGSVIFERNNVIFDFPVNYCLFCGNKLVNNKRINKYEKMVDKNVEDYNLISEVREEK